MSESTSHRRRISRAAGVLALLAVGAGLSSCASVGDNMSTAFADPAKYDLYECKQLETERVRIAARKAELNGLMAKAETGVGGSVVAELAYRNELIATQGQSKFAEEAWRRNKCQESPPESKPAASAAATPPAPSAGVRGSRPSSR
ncbi:twin-arginine translocation pathway signal [Bradyrhizobium sp. AUGA SZCCT0182]|uniref:twin-arginine translocation pathway signal n=1 Tax=Bradyrhizobium sp. AUGA SZCCT0182 TaxID=2807667 RepID=UPI001BAB95B9|nr:twin-arginine translocation pathway signal [Bradyrhizobium sp. AUGA SZCCT0182]MBR1233358.1 twin-arginine translocation pathway signal [Bradyrhizobium sp. AUGA SZCCT0182]